MKHLFVKFTLASKLKKKGFNEPCFGHYENQRKKLVINYTNLPPVHPMAKKRPKMFEVTNMNSELPQWATSAPTYQQVVDWFREKHNIDINVFSDCNVNEILGYTYQIHRLMAISNVFLTNKKIPYYEHYKALSKAIEEALKLIK